MNILFSQTREDPQIELDILHRLHNPRALLIGSGGCNALNLMAENYKVDIIDANIEQIYLIQLKIVLIKNLDKLDYLNFIEGSTSETHIKTIFEVLNDELSEECKNYWIKNKKYLFKGINKIGKFEELFRELKKNNYNFTKVFSNDNLIKYFGEDAVKYTNYSFSEHFENIYNIYQKKYDTTNNYFYTQFVDDCYNMKCLPQYLTNYEKVKNHLHNNNILYYKDKIHLIDINTKYDLISISNIFDWCSKNQFDIVLNKVFDMLNGGGYIVIRRLLGDYDLEKVISKFFKIVNKKNIDKSHFYSECVIGQK